MYKMKLQKISINRAWGFIFLLFFMSIISVLASFLMDQKLYKKQKNHNELEILKASFSHTRKELIDIKRNIVVNTEKFNLKRHSNVIIVKYE